MRKRRIRPRSGESLAEILVSTLIFLMMTAVLQGAVSFSTNAQRKSEQIRKTSQEICLKLRKTPPVSDGKTADYIFSPDGNESNQLFTVRVSLQTKTVLYEDENGETKSSVFYVFGTEPESEGGAGEPETGGEAP